MIKNLTPIHNSFEGETKLDTTDTQYCKFQYYHRVWYKTTDELERLLGLLEINAPRSDDGEWVRGGWVTNEVELDNGLVLNEAHVCGDSKISGIVKDNAYIHDSQISAFTVVSGNARVVSDSHLAGANLITGDSLVKDSRLCLTKIQGPSFVENSNLKNCLVEGSAAVMDSDATTSIFSDDANVQKSNVAGAWFMHGTFMFRGEVNGPRRDDIIVKSDLIRIQDRAYLGYQAYITSPKDIFFYRGVLDDHDPVTCYTTSNNQLGVSYLFESYTLGEFQSELERRVQICKEYYPSISLWEKEAELLLEMIDVWAGKREVLRN